MKMILASSLLLSAAALCLGGCGTGTTPNYASYPIQVVDRDTKQPIAGALISFVPTGGSQYTTNVYYTDNEGAATVRYHADSHFAVVQIRKEGYEGNSTALRPTNSVVRLKKLE